MTQQTRTMASPGAKSLRVVIAQLAKLGQITAIVAAVYPLGALAQELDADTFAAQGKRLNELDIQTQEVKTDAISMQNGMQDLNRAITDPQDNAVSVYFAVGLPSFVVESVEISFNERVLITRKYEYNDAVALTYGGADLIMETPFPVGVHALEAAVVGRYANDDRDAPPLRRTLIHQIGVSDQPQTIEFSLNWTGQRRAPKLDVREWTINGQLVDRPILISESGTVNRQPVRSLALRDVQFLVETERLFTALARFRYHNAKEHFGADKTPAALMHANALLGLGLHREAEAIFAELRDASFDPEDFDEKEGVDPRNRAMLRLAKYEYERGYFEQAIITLLRDLREPVSSEIEKERQALLGRTYMRTQQFDEAILAFDTLGRRTRMEPFTRFNLAVTLLRAGQTEEGLELLDSVGGIRIPNETMLALRDKANLTLAYQLMSEGRYDDAKDAFRRISLRGQFGNKGLLGYGWAQYYAAQPDEEDNVNPGFETLAGLTTPGRGNASFFERLGIGLTDEQELRVNYRARLNRALVPWSELLGRDPMHHAVQETYIALPNVLESLGAHQQSLNYYLRGIDLLEETRRRLDVAEQHVRDGRMIETLIRRDIDKQAGWTWEVRDLPNAPETYYLYQLIASTRFQEALKNYRDLRFLDRTVDTWLTDLARHGRMLANANQPSEPQSTAPATLPTDGPNAELYDRVRPDLNLDEGFSGATPEDYAANPELAARVIRRDLALALAERTGAAAISARRNRDPSLETRVLAMRPQLFELQSRIESTLVDERQLLETMALDELQGQRAQAEEFLIEARFAVARLYDSGEPNDSLSSDNAGDTP